MSDLLQDKSKLRAEVIHAVCFKPSILGHLEQFERIEALIERATVEARRKAYKRGYNSGFIKRQRIEVRPAKILAQLKLVIRDLERDQATLKAGTPGQEGEK